MPTAAGIPATATVSARLAPAPGLDILSRHEVARLRDASAGGLHPLLRRCALAVLTQGSDSDDARALLERYPDFDIQILQQDRGLKVELIDAPAQAFVDGRIIRGVNELLHAVIRDIVYISAQLEAEAFDLGSSVGITHAVFEILRNARVLRANVDPNLVVCWGGHSIPRSEYDYTKQVGYQIGLRGMDICTGCGPGAMKGPMKGATIAHAKQRRRSNRYIGITEPGIIAAESPNPIVNHLVIMPDIEKRLEAFVRISHAIVVFPGGVGTAEEILYLLGILLHPVNAAMPFPLIFTGPRESAAYFEQIDRFLRLALGDAVSGRYRIIIDDPAAVGREAAKGIERVRAFRLDNKDAFFFNWALTIEQDFQVPFRPTHEAMAALNLHRDQPAHRLAADLRRAFSGIVAGNVKEEGMRAIERHGPFEIDGDREVMHALDAMLASFVVQQRMKLPGTRYVPCYRVRVD
ncbi:MAG TPA: nucleotide 5'-monophosphate nucleosidase PpnN [Dokdonella sp.]|uniref:nucleotide 5'-monophosphate nucleosidase PpnN n=1 Tax=Dokdonella sp. TaxID=2291710 RepID=UPI002C2706BF|nr:nucleotide 5'-monophosphate nucleosidase PpnN [Dokdonella sp.]HUD42300.1 nucleotide 5'-monophosphate nucleosidase PpnN [Dokdonella sp.]